MPTVTLLEKVYGSFSPENFEPVFSSLCKGLKVKLKVVGETNRGWVQIEVSGEDENAALNFIDREMGKIADRKFLTHKIIERRKEQFGESDTHTERDKAEKNGFTEKLMHQIFPPGTQNFPHTDFPESSRVPGYCKVHIINGSDDENEEGDATQDIGIKRVAAGHIKRTPLCTQIDFLKGL